MITDRDKRVIERETAGLVKAEGTICRVTRPHVAAEGGFYGPHEDKEAVISEALPVEFHYGSPHDLKQEGADATADVEFSADVNEGDFLEFEGVRYRVTDIAPHTLFGARAYKTLTLEREYKE